MSLNNQLRSRNKKAFTLIELLVVIAIIALLLSILMPALQTVKKQAQNVICKSNLRQWGLTWKLYTEDNDGKFPNLKDRDENVNSNARRSYWSECLAPYLDKGSRGKGIYFCPAAERDPKVGGPRPANEFTSFQLAKMDAETGPVAKRSSYGINCWVYNGLNAAFSQDAWKKDAGLNNSRNIPLLLDSKWRGGFPLETDKPLKSGNLIVDQFGNVVSTGKSVGEMGYFQMKRHKHGINAAFLDYSVRGVEPKELWSLKWHRAFNTRYADSNITWEYWMN